jgi:DNA-binding response OmpR family regulator
MSHDVLLIEDDTDFAALVRLHLQDLGCVVTTATDGTAGLAVAIERGPWSLVVLDLGLPRLESLEICRRLRLSGSNTPILMLTARAAGHHRVLRPNTSTDAYLTKPFSVAEFGAKAKALLRRAERLSRSSASTQRTLRFGELQVDLDQRLARRAGLPLKLTAKEFDLLAHLMRHPWRVFSRAQLLHQIWGTRNAFEHTVNSHINRLRSKLEPDPTTPRFIVTVWGAGYRFAGFVELQLA